MDRIRSKGSFFSLPHLKKKAVSSWSAVQDTYFSTKDIFERHRVVFTVGTSVASVATAWAGYSLRHLHDSKVDQRLESIERVMKQHQHLEQAELKKLVGSGNSSAAVYLATAATTFIVGYGFGWQGGKWYANRKFRQEQMKLLGQMTPKRWQLLAKIKPKELKLQFLKRRLMKSREPETTAKSSGILATDAPTTTQKPELLQQKS